MLYRRVKVLEDPESEDDLVNTVVDEGEAFGEEQIEIKNKGIRDLVFKSELNLGGLLNINEWALQSMLVLNI